MDIGTHLQKARADAGLTQEQVAEALEISRQTLSNWENGKTYPDIRNAVKLSELYGISMDQLLKEEKPMSDYLDYLEESTDVVKSKNRLSKIILIVAYLAIWGVCVLVFHFGISGSDAMAFAMLFIMGLLPLTAFAESVIIGANHFWGNWKWLVPILFGVMWSLAGYATFNAANMMTTGNFYPPDLSTVPYGVLHSLAGIAIGSAVRFIKGKIRRNENERPGWAALFCVAVARESR